MNIVTTVERDNGTGVMSTEHTILTKIGGGISSTLTPRPGHFSVQHCNLILEIAESDSETKSSNETRV